MKARNNNFAVSFILITKCQSSYHELAAMSAILSRAHCVVVNIFEVPLLLRCSSTDSQRVEEALYY